MRSFAMLPLGAVVLVSLCGSPVPPPPSDVTGTVFFDANRNAIRDSCDGVLVGADLVLENTDKRLTTTTGGAGKFTFSKVPDGPYTLRFQRPSGRYWPVTTVTGGSDGLAVAVNGANVTGVALGSATTVPLDDGPRVIGLAYEDTDGDGAVSRDECGIDFVDVEVASPARRAPNVDTPGSFEIITPQADFGTISVVPPQRGTTWWVQTATGSACPGPIAPQPRYANGVYELNVGFQARAGTASISGVAFADADRDGLRDDDEPGVPNVFVNASLDLSGKLRRRDPLPAKPVWRGWWVRDTGLTGHHLSRNVLRPGTARSLLRRRAARLGGHHGQRATTGVAP